MNKYRIEMMTGAFTSLSISFLNIFGDMPIRPFHIYWLIISFIFGGVAGVVGGWLVSKFGSERDEIFTGFLAGALVYMIQLYILITYTVASPTYYP